MDNFGRTSLKPVAESSRRSPRNDTEAGHPTESTSLLHSSRGSTDTTGGSQTGAEGAPPRANYTEIFMDYLGRCSPCLGRREQTSSTQDDPIPTPSAAPEAVVLIQPPSSSAIDIKPRSR